MPFTDTQSHPHITCKLYCQPRSGRRGCAAALPVRACVCVFVRARVDRTHTHARARTRTRSDAQGIPQQGECLGAALQMPEIAFLVGHGDLREELVGRGAANQGLLRGVWRRGRPAQGRAGAGENHAHVCGTQTEGAWVGWHMPESIIYPGTGGGETTSTFAWAWKKKKKKKGHTHAYLDESAVGDGVGVLEQLQQLVSPLDGAPAVGDFTGGTHARRRGSERKDPLVPRRPEREAREQGTHLLTIHRSPNWMAMSPRAARRTASMSFPSGNMAFSSRKCTI